jgi:formylmethanofuran dehydrogenase subunit A
LYRNAVKSIDALGQTIVSAGVDNLQSYTGQQVSTSLLLYSKKNPRDTVKEQLVAHGGTAMEDLVRFLS